jgi:hypothetical protein
MKLGGMSRDVMRLIAGTNDPISAILPPDGTNIYRESGRQNDFVG